jgi:hypothetical protein
MTDIPLYGEQYTLLQDWLNSSKHCIDIVPVGSGKTFLASIALPIFATNDQYHRGKDIIYSAPTTAMIKSLIWEPLKTTCINQFGLQDAKHINNSELTIRFPNGVFIRCKSAEQRENLRGLNAGIWVADEAALYTSNVLQEITNRLRPKVGQPDTGGRLIVISTPNGNGPLYDLFKAAVADQEHWIVRHMNYEQMRSGNRAYIERQRQILSPLKFSQDYLCSWETVQDQFYYTWNSHLYCDAVHDRGGTLYSFHDFNKRRMCATIVQVSRPGELDGKIEVIKTYAIPDCSTEGIAKAIREDFPQRNILSIIDMSGTQLNRDTTSEFGKTDRTILEQYGFRIVNTKKSNPLISDTDNSSNAFIQRGGLVVQPDDQLLLEALSTYHYEDAGRKRLVKYEEQQYAHIDGLGDCIRYGIHHLFPVRHHINNHVTDGITPQPGAQYLKQGHFGPGTPTLEELIRGEPEHDYCQF